MLHNCPGLLIRGNLVMSVAINNTCREDDKKAQRSNDSPKVALEAVSLAATANDKATTIPYDTPSHNQTFHRADVNVSICR